MDNGTVLELASLPQRHPIGDMFLRRHGPDLIVRLSIDPVSLPPGTTTCDIRVDRQSRMSKGQSTQHLCVIGWNDLADCSREFCLHTHEGVPERDATEGAAIVVMALLIHELEGATVLKAIDIGDGGDYLIQFGDATDQSLVEVSGVRKDVTGVRSRSRLVEKKDQVLSKSPTSYASVTTFSHSKAQTPHSYLHFVEKERKKPTGRKRGKRK